MRLVQPGATVSAGPTELSLVIVPAPAQLRAGEPAPQKAGARSNMKISSIPKSGRKGSVVYVNSRHGKVAREYVRPRNPRTPEQQDHRNNFRAVTGRWHTLTPEQRAAWCAATANKYFVNEAGRRVRLNGKGASSRQ